MRLLSLGLERFGSFSDFTLRFDPSKRLHVVCGPNEAGKSTTLRAIRAALFGIQRNTVDDHLHSKPDLRIRFEFTEADGQVRELVRTNALKAPLKTLEGEPFAMERWSALLGETSELTFTRLYGLDHETLRSGGDELARGEGDAGTSLFEASVGGGATTALLGALKAEADLIHTKNAKSRPLREKLSRRDAAEKTVVEASVAPDRAIALDASLATTSDKRAELTQERHARQRTLTRLRAQKKALSARANLDSARAELVQLGTTKPWSHDLERSFIEARTEARAAADSHASCTQILTRINAEVAALPAPDSLLHAGPALDALAANLSLLESRHQTLPVLRAELNELKAKSLTSRILPEQATARVLDSAIKRAAAARTAAQKVRDLRRQLEAVEHKLAALQASDPVRHGHIVQLEAWLSELDLHAAHRQRERVTELRKSFDHKRRAAGFSHDTPDGFIALSVPPPHVLDGVRLEASALRDKRRDLETTMRARQEGLLGAERQIAQISAEGPLVSDESVQYARTSRDAKVAELTGALNAAATASARHAIHELVRHADDLADQRAREASRITELARIRADLAVQARDAITQQTALDAHEHVEAELHSRIAQLVAPLRAIVDGSASANAEQTAGSASADNAVVESSSAFADKALLERWDAANAIVTVAAELCAAGNQLATLLTHDGAAQIQLSSAIRDFDAVPIGTTTSALKDQLSQLIRAWQSDNASMLALQKDAQRSREILTLECTRAAQSLDERTVELHESCMLLEFRVETSYDTIEAIAGDWLVALEGQSRERSTAGKIHAFELELDDAATSVLEILAIHATDLAKVPVLGALRTLLTRLAVARHQNDRRTTNIQELTGAQNAEHNAAASLSAATAKLRQIYGRIGVATDESAITEIEKSKRLHGLTAEVAILSQQIRDYADGNDLEWLQTSLAAEEIANLILSVEGQLTGLDAEISMQDAEIGKLSAERTAQDRQSDAAADAAAAVEMRLSEAKELALQWMRLSVGRKLLEREIERHREATMGPTLREASAIFSQLTRGGFEGLSVRESDKDGKPLLVGVRQNGSTVATTAMSDGTRDQLFLSLRLAVHALRARNATVPLPLVLDDVFVHFDDARTRAAFDAIAALPAGIDVIYFTHHPHLAELAMASKAADICEILRLPSASVLP